jgi:hypothetical protein
MPCVKNTLLASTVLLTSGANYMSASEPLVTRYLDEVVDCLSDRMVRPPLPTPTHWLPQTNPKQTAKVAAGCIGTLLLQSPKTPADQSISRYLLPRLISFTTNTANDDPENARALVTHALTIYTTTLPGPQKAIAMSVVVPTLLARANREGEDVYQETSARLLDLAGSDQAAFRSVVGGMSAEQKGFMESVIWKGRQIRGAGKAVDENEGREPTIALRMDFGG